MLVILSFTYEKLKILVEFLVNLFSLFIGLQITDSK